MRELNEKSPNPYVFKPIVFLERISIHTRTCSGTYNQKTLTRVYLTTHSLQTQVTLMFSCYFSVTQLLVCKIANSDN